MRAKQSVLNLCIALVLVFTAFASAKPVLPVVAGVSNIRISQVYGGGGNAGSLYKNDFIELYNPTAAPISLEGWSVQYASSTGTTWAVTPLTGSILANGYYLVQEAKGTGGTVDLPTPDAIGTIAMSASSGKVALVSNAVTLTGGCPLGGAVMDFVGYGSADCYEGSAAAPTLSNTTSDSRLDAGCYDSDVNSADFTAGAVNPRNSATAIHLCGSSPVVPVCPTSIRTNQNTATSAAFSASDADGFVVTAAITSSAVTGISLTAVTPASTYGGTLTGTLSISADTPGDVDPYYVEITFTNNDLTPQTATCTVEVLVIPLNCPPPLTPIKRIGEVQGTGTTSPFVGQSVTVMGTVTADYQENSELKGYFLQDQGDGNTTTSDGIFVYDTTNDVLVGDKVMFEGTVAEYNGLTELKVVGEDPGTEICGMPLPMPGVTAISLPQATATSFEAYEGMLVNLNQTLTVSQNYFQGRYGQLTLSSGGRMYHPNNGNELGDTVELNARRFIVLDDGSTTSNPNPVPYYDLAQPLRAGDTVVSVSGVMDQGAINATSPYLLGYRVHPSTAPVFTPVNLRPGAPALIGHDLVVVGFNLYNFFTTLNDPANTYPNPPYNTSNEPRGANNATEFEQQVLKLVAAIHGANPDVLGVVEIEKYEGGPFPAADTYLLDRLNDGLPEDEQYEIINDPVLGFGGDYIKNTIYYKPGRLTLVGNAVSYNIPDPADPTVDLFDRYPVAQTFRSKSDNQKFTVVVNHLKSKTCTGATGAELDLGQGCWNAKRTRQATALLDFVNTLTAGAGDPDILLIGDYNAYAEEDPIDVFKAAGMVDTLKTVPAASRYTYVFDGQAGYLDQAIGSASLANYVKEVQLWHINADEPTVIDYDNNYNPPGYYAANAYRSSDHDPVWVRLNVSDEPILLNSLVDQTAMQGLAFTYAAGANFYDADVPQFDTLTFTASGVPAWLSLDPATGIFSGTPANGDVTSVPISITVRATDAFSQFVEDTFTLVVVNVNDAPTVANLLVDQTTAQGTLLTYQFAANSFADVDIVYGDSLTYSASGNPTWFAFTPGTRTFSGTPGALDVGGPYNIVVRATDSQGAFVEDTFTLTVTNINDNPVLSAPLADQNATEDVVFSYAAGASFSDVDVPLYDTLTYSVSAIPAWLTFNTSTGAFSGTPTNADVTSAPISITVRATDAFGLFAEDTFDLVVTNVNDAPTLAVALVDQTTAQGTLLTYQFAANSFADVDIIHGDSLTYSASGNPAWFVFTPGTRTFSGTPGALDVGGPYNIVVRATDSQGAFVEDTFTLTVTNVNDSPVLSAPLVDQNATEDVAFTYVAGASFNDVDVPAYDTLTFSAAGAPAWLMFNTTTGTFSGTPTNADVTSAPITITVRATDIGGLYAEDVFTLVVTNVNDLPTVAANIPDQKTTAGQPFTFTFAAGTFADVDIPYGDTLSYTASLADGFALPAWLTFDPVTRTFSGTPAIANKGIYHIKVVATDLALTTAYDVFDLLVAQPYFLPFVNK